MRDYSFHSEFVKKFDEEVQNYIQQGIGDFNEEIFNQLALREFEIQYNNIEYLKSFCQAKGVIPNNIKSWEQIPAIPSEIFKNNIVAAFPLQETELSLMTSGTSDPNSRGKIYRDKRCVELLYLANEVMTRNFLFPDVERMKILLMVPSPKVAPAMGMAVGLEQMRQNFGSEDSIYLITPNGMEWEMLFQALHESEETGRPVAIVGATSGLVYLFNFCREQRLSFRLPEGCRICDGGGYLGTFGECSRAEYLQLCEEVLGIPPEHCVNTLGSSESGTNYFDNVLRNKFLGLKDIPRYKVSPPWARTIAVDPVTGKRVPKGEIGLLSHYDLVNRSNLFALQTNNFGYEIETGFEIIGRADAKGRAVNISLNTMIHSQGCSTTADRMLTGNQTGVCSTVADSMLTGSTGVCSTVADDMLDRQQEVCSTTADELIKKSPHGNMFSGISKERLEKLKQMCPFLRLQGMLKKNNAS